MIFTLHGELTFEMFPVYIQRMMRQSEFVFLAGFFDDFPDTGIIKFVHGSVMSID